MRQFFNKLKSLKVVVALLLAVSAIGGGALYVNKADAVAACDWTNIVYCGMKSANAAGLKDLYNSSKDTKGRTDIRKIMQWGGFTNSNIASANNNNVKIGYLTRDGVVKVNGQTVATNSVVATRLYKPGRSQILSGVYSRPSSQNQLASEQVLVLFDNSGKAVGALMVRCGNVMRFTPVIPKNPSLVCTNLTVQATGKTREYKFTATAAAKDTAISSYVFYFGDGGYKTINTTSSTASVTHTYNNNMTVSTGRVFVNGTHQKNVTSTACQKDFNLPVPPKPPVKTPKIDIVKKVINKQNQKVDHTVVDIDAVYSYDIVVTNTGQVDLKDAVVTDTPAAGVTLLENQAVGVVTNNVWKTTIPTLAVGKSQTFTLKAKVPVYQAGSIKNTVCVDTPTVPGNPDDCDEATVEVVKPKVPGVSIDKVVNGKENISVPINTPFTYTLTVKNTGEVDLVNAAVTDQAPAGVEFISTDKGSVNGNKLNYTIPSLAVGQSVTINIQAKATVYSKEAIVNTACVDTPTVPGSPDDCDDAKITVPKPEDVQVCDVTTGTIITVPVTEKDKYEPVDSDKCAKIEVCIIADGTGEMVTITKDQFDSAKHSTNSEDCVAKPVTPPVTPPAPELPAVLPSTGPAEVLGSILGAGGLGYGGYAYAASRRALKNAR